MLSFSDLKGLDADALRAAFAGPPEEVAKLVRVAAEGGNVEAQLQLGQRLLDGIGVARSPEEALRWFVAAAKAGEPLAINMVGRCIEHGWGTPVDKAKAAEWYRSAAERVLDWGLYNLATLYALGEGVEKDLAKALDLFRQAAALGHVKSINMIGGFYEDGWVVPADHAIAADHYARAAEGGDFRGQFNHARFLIEEGKIDEGFAWLARIPATATPRFMRQVRSWLVAQDDARVRGPHWTIADAGVMRTTRISRAADLGS